MTAHDLVVRGGSVIDGTGGEPYIADVAIDGRTIVEVGRVDGRGREEIDADGLAVLPGFVDIHTHYDGQAVWDSRLQPSSWHGVTTVVAGNCGVGFAPCHPADRDRLIDLMEGVEDIPGVALQEGLDWAWETFPEFLDRLGRRRFDLDIGVQVPHAALRVYTMGERASAREIATDDDLAAMAALAQEAVAAGALGFSTSRTLNHKSISGELTPSYAAAQQELVTIATAIGRTGAGVIQLVSDALGGPEPAEEVAAEVDILRAVLRASGRPVSFSLTQRHDAPQRYREILGVLDDLVAEGHEIRAQVAARGIGVLMGFECTLHPFMTNPVWRDLAALPTAERLARVQQPEVRAAILATYTGEKDTNVLGGGGVDRWHRMWELTDPPAYEPDPAQSIAKLAAREGRAPAEVAYDLMAADGGRGMIYSPFANFAGDSLEATATMLGAPHTIPGLSDGGAHVGTICDGSFPTTLLEYWGRDRDHGTLPIPFLVRRQAYETARAAGLHDRGLLAPGQKADLNVVDLPHVRLHKPEIRYDLPSGGRRLVQRADGYEHTVVSGVETYRAGEATDALPGRLVRGAATRG